jgi:phosphopantothenoylcysteine decarboxylase/phosphopantothenate--cysteine ligase
VVLGVCGGIAAYKAVQVARDLTLLGAEVDVVLTAAAGRFVGALSFEALTGRPVRTDIFAAGDALAHIRLAREAHVVCVAPATADFLARAAHGRADDLLTAILLATRAPVLLCPAMNDAMWAHPQTAANVRHLREALAYGVVEPAVGPLAHGEGQGAGRLPEPELLVGWVGRLLEPRGPLAGRRVVVSAGPTREQLDPVRVLTNRSSGRMGYALAEAAWRRGAAVTLVSGPTSLADPPGVDVVRVEDTASMAGAVQAALPAADVLLMAAAPADFRPTETAAAKTPKGAMPTALELAVTPDVLVSTRAARPAGMVVVGFALQTGRDEAAAREKLAAKGLDLIVLNDALEPGAGFEVETNRVVLLGADGNQESLPLLSKHDVAEAILDRVERLLPAAGLQA